MQVSESKYIESMHGNGDPEIKTPIIYREASSCLQVSGNSSPKTNLQQVVDILEVTDEKELSDRLFETLKPGNVDPTLARLLTLQATQERKLAEIE
jgi:hypothetical protein